MTGTECGGRRAGWFAVLADCASGTAAAAAFGAEGGCGAGTGPGAAGGARGERVRVVRHASGRPWLVGSWDDDELTVVAAGPVRVAVIGTCSADTPTLRAAAGGLASLSDLDTAARTWAGSYHLLASAHGQVSVRGTASGTRRVFHARLGDTVVAADRSDVLGPVVGAGLNEDVLALRLIPSDVPHPLDGLSVWRDVEALPPGHRLELGHDAIAHARQWWFAPEGELTVAEGAPALTRALSDAVALRTRDGGTISADLSEGMDSTLLCFLADGGPARLLAVTRSGLDSPHQDADRARRALAALGPGTVHRAVDGARLPAWFTGLSRAGEGMDEPAPGIRDRARIRHMSRELAVAGSRLHLSGEGGDQVLLAAYGYLHDALRSRPSVAWPQLRATAARPRRRPAAMVRAVTDRRPYGRWLADAAKNLAPHSPDPLPDLGWQLRPSLPEWVTPDATATVRRLLTEAAATAVPVEPTRGGHGTLAAVRATARASRDLARVAAEAGTPVHHPYFDDRVLEACLAVRPYERTSPFVHKPLRAAALRGIVPDDLLGRRTRDDATAELNAGLHRNRTELTELLDSPLLARLGLIDPGPLRRAVLDAHAARTSLPAIENTLALEAWLRAATAWPPRPGSRAEEGTLR
ncbi:asparagine synthase-related protein [Streptomyces sp. NPDC088116]|uniref:asparagine synthase-related protein n=1 Tax=Streptomyces sp. NPDC088116 TaxID=3365825 RepID=UPI003828818C